MRSLTPLLLAAVFAARVCAAEGEPKIPSFHVEVTGSGSPVLLIPGLASSGEVWDGTVAHLRATHQCHVFTLAGFAGEPRIPRPFLETVRNDLAAYIRANHLDHPIIIGHSLGGFLALWLAAQNPDLVGPLVIVDSVPYLPAVYNPAATIENTRPMAEQIRAGMAIGGEAYLKHARAAAAGMVTSPADIYLVYSWSKTTDPTAAADAMYDMFTTDLRPDVPSIRVPTLVLGTWIAYGTDAAMRAQVEKSFESQYARLKGVRIVLADHARHFIMLDDPNWFYAQLDAFLAHR